MKILIYKNTQDSDLVIGQKVCYKDTNGVYAKLGTITDIYQDFGITHYILNTSFGSYLASELKLIEEVEHNKETNEFNVTIGRYSLRQTIVRGEKYNECTFNTGEYVKLINKHSQECNHLFLALHNYKVENNIY